MALMTSPPFFLAPCPILDSHFTEMAQIGQCFGMVVQLSVIVVEISYTGAREFQTVGTVSYRFTLRTGPDGAFGAKGYQLPFTETSITLKVLPLDFGLLRAQLLHEFFGPLIAPALAVQVYRTGAAIKSAGCDQIFAVLGGLRSADAPNFQAG